MTDVRPTATASHLDSTIKSLAEMSAVTAAFPGSGHASAGSASPKGLVTLSAGANCWFGERVEDRFRKNLAPSSDVEHQRRDGAIDRAQTCPRNDNG
jgi:hypothetical protein